MGTLQRGKETSFKPGNGENWRPNPTIASPAADRLYYAMAGWGQTPSGILSSLLAAVLNEDGSPLEEFKYALAQALGPFVPPSPKQAGAVTQLPVPAQLCLDIPVAGSPSTAGHRAVA